MLPTISELLDRLVDPRLAPMLFCCLPIASPPTRLLSSATSIPDEHDESVLDDSIPLTSALVIHHTTVALIPPDAAWPPIQAARWLVRDKGLWRWPPHANLLYPFVAPRRFREAAPVLAAALADIAPFEVTLSEMRIFTHKRSATLWLHPAANGEELQQLQAALQRAMPQCDAQTASFGNTFTPHVTVGHFADEGAALEARATIQASDAWPAEGVKFQVDCVIMMARDGPDAQFEPRWRLPLGGRPAVNPLPQGERFAGMPHEVPEFCVKDQNRAHAISQRPKWRSKSRRGQGRAEKQGGAGVLN